MSVTVQLEGIKELEADIKQLAKKFPGSFKEQVKESGRAVQRNAIKFAPKDTGNLRKSISEGGFELQDDGNTAEVSANTNYAAHVEFGTSKQSAQPYLGPAFRLE